MDATVAVRKPKPGFKREIALVRTEPAFGFAIAIRDTIPSKRGIFVVQPDSCCRMKKKKERKEMGFFFSN